MSTENERGGSQQQAGSAPSNLERRAESGVEREVGAELVWTRTKPTVPGFYWVRCNQGRKTKPEVKEFAVEDKYATTPGSIEPLYGPYSTAGWDWFAGPLTPPVGARGKRVGGRATKGHNDE